MSRPYKPSNSSVYWVRKVVPEELRPLIGKRELKASLGTRDPAEARERAPAALAEFERILRQAKEGQRFTRSDLDALAAEYYRRRKEELLREARRAHWAWERFDSEELGHDSITHRPSGTDHEDPEEAAVIAWGMPKVEALLQSFDVVAPPAFKERLAIELYRTEPKAIRAARADHLLTDQHEPEPSATFRSPAARSLPSLFEQYAKAKELRSATVEQWGRVIAHFDQWLNGKPADAVTPMDVQRYADEVQQGKGLSGRKLSAKTVNESYLAAIRGTYSWAMKPGRALVSSNPADGVFVDTPRHEGGPKRRGYNRDEVAQLLSAARHQTTAYKRWVPWLLAFTGARVSEILNAKKADIGQTEGAWFIAIREQAEGESGAKLKNTWSSRCVPLHPALLAEGFLAYVESLPEGEHLFPGKWADKHGNRTKTPANRLRDWLNTVRPPEEGIAPNHSFRHWLINECKRAGIDPDFQRQLTGHSIKDAHGRYGPGDVPVLMESLRRIPSPLCSKEK